VRWSRESGLWRLAVGLVAVLFGFGPALTPSEELRSVRTGDDRSQSRQDEEHQAQPTGRGTGSADAGSPDDGRRGRDAGAAASSVVAPRAVSLDRTALAAELRKAVEEQRFGSGLVDLMPPGSPTRARADRGDTDLSHRDAVRNTRTPVVDAAVIELDASGRATGVANVVLSKDYPGGVVVPVGADLGTTQVRWRRWDTEQWDAGSRGSEDVVPGREDAALEAMSPYPASVLKLMVAFGILRLVDRGVLDLDETYSYRPPDSTCGEPGRARLRDWLDKMITISDNRATCALMKRMHDLDEVGRLNETFQRLGLRTLQVRNTNPATGGEWLGMSMSALDTARLLLILAGGSEAGGSGRPADGGSATLWRTSAGVRVTPAVLAPSSRAYFARVLADQGLNQALSTPNWCGRDYPARGIPQRVPERWIDPEDGTLTVDYRVYGQDVRPCNRHAEVEFAHKTGLSNQAGADAGIVTSLPGAAPRRYVVVVFTNLGQRFADAHKPPDPRGTYSVSYTEKLAKLGSRIDEIMTRRAADAP
jgi:Beta-lactamase enzyme family